MTDQTKESDTVYVLLVVAPHEGSYLHGVYSTREKAEETARSLVPPERHWIVIHDVEVDAPPDFRGTFSGEWEDKS